VRVKAFIWKLDRRWHRQTSKRTSEVRPREMVSCCSLDWTTTLSFHLKDGDLCRHSLRSLAIRCWRGEASLCLVETKNVHKGRRSTHAWLCSSKKQVHKPFQTFKSHHSFRLMYLDVLPAMEEGLSHHNKQLMKTLLALTTALTFHQRCNVAQDCYAAVIILSRC